MRNLIYYSCQITSVLILVLLQSSRLWPRGNNKNTNNQPKMNPGQGQQVAQAQQTVPGAQGLHNSPSLASNLSADIVSNNEDAPKYFFQEKYAPLNVKGNFLTLCACPKNVELGEWLAHQSKLQI